MRTAAFAKRTFKELLRDPLNLFFGLGFPVILILLLTLIQNSIPDGGTDMFEIPKLAPGIAVFGLSFISLFSGMLIAKDRSDSLLLRLFTTPMRASDFILGYALPLFPIAICQIIICFAVSSLLGLGIGLNTLAAIAVLIPASLVFIALGFISGSLLTDKQVGGVCGALLTNITAWLSGAWIPIDLIGGAFKQIADLLPFSHAVNAARAAVAGSYGSIFPDLWWVIGYGIVLMALAVFVFSKKMNGERV